MNFYLCCKLGLVVSLKLRLFYLRKRITGFP